MPFCLAQVSMSVETIFQRNMNMTYDSGNAIQMIPKLVMYLEIRSSTIRKYTEFCASAKIIFGITMLVEVRSKMDVMITTRITDPIRTIFTEHGLCIHAKEHFKRLFLAMHNSIIMLIMMVTSVCFG